MLKNTGTILAKHLMKDDNFKIAGTMYRITETDTNVLNVTIIVATPFNEALRPAVIELTVPSDTIFNLWNQQ